MCLELREQHTRAGSPWAELCVGHCCPLSLLPERKAGTALSQQHPGHTTICPCGFYLVQNRLNSHPIFFREAQSHLPSADAGKQDEEQVPELLHLLSDLFYHTLQKRIQFWTQKASLYQVERAQLQVPLPAGYKQRASWGDQGPRYTCVCIYRLCTTAPEALPPTSGGELLAEQWFRNTSTHRGFCCSAGPIQDKRLQEMLQF